MTTKYFFWCNSSGKTGDFFKTISEEKQPTRFKIDISKV